MNNRFDDQAASWDDDPAKVERARAVADAVASVIPLMGDERVLEYGAGTGLTAQALGERVGKVVLADSSGGMRAVMERKIAEAQLPATAEVWNLDLTRDEPPAQRFDLIVSNLVLHHIQDLQPVLEGFHTLLDPGGHIAIADLDEEDGSFHEHTHDFDGHNGFDRTSLVGNLTQAGFVDVAFTDCGVVEKNDKQFGLFLATAQRR